jgi:hypothetical protein
MGQGSAIVEVHLDPDGQTSHALACELQSSREIGKGEEDKVRMAPK